MHGSCSCSRPVRALILYCGLLIHRSFLNIRNPCIAAGLRDIERNVEFSSYPACNVLHFGSCCPNLHEYEVYRSSAGLLYASGGWLCNLLALHLGADLEEGLSASSEGTLPGLLASLTFCSISLPNQPFLVLSAGPFQPTAKLHAQGYVYGALHPPSSMRKSPPCPCMPYGVMCLEGTL